MLSSLDGATIDAMDVVVERGLARCPRCAGTADYCFVECGTDSIRYEIECQACGEHYREQNSTSPTAFSTASFVAPTPTPAPAQTPAARVVAELRRSWASAVDAVARLRS
jgi:hypothetical protein